MPRYREIVSAAGEMHHSRRAAIAIVVLAFAISPLATRSGLRSASAAWWITYLSLPLFRVVLLQWAWRWLVWVTLLARVSRLELRLEPSHPDLAGGLGFLEQATTSFLGLQVATGAVLGARLLVDVGARTTDLHSIKVEVAAFGVITVAMTLGPLTLFSRKLLRAKHRGQLDYGALASRHNQRFADQWLNDASKDPLGDPSISSLADLGTGYQSVDRMRPLPLGRQSLIALAVVCVIPVLPVVLGHVPLQESLKQILKTVLL